MSNYNVKTIARTAVPRSKRLREGAAPEGSAGGAGGNSHSHSNKVALDLLRYDAELNLLYIGDSNNPINFAAFGDVTAGGVGSGGGGGGATYLYQLEDVPDYRVSYRGKYLRAKSDGNGVEWVDVQGGSTWGSITGTLANQLDLMSALNAKADASALANYQPLATAINTGNIASQSVAYAGNAGTVGGLSASSFAQWKNYSSPDVMYDFGWGRFERGGSPAGGNFGQLLTMPYRKATGNTIPDFAWQILAPNGDDPTNPDDIFVRTSLATSWRTWHKLYHSGNCNNTSTPWSASSLTLNGAISGATQINFNGKGSNEIGLEVLTDSNGNRYLHTTLPFCSDNEITAGGVGTGGGGGVNYLYMLEDVPDYRTAYRGKYLRAKSDGSGVEWVDVTGGVSSVISLTGDITQSQLRTALGLGSAAYTASSAYATATQGSHADTAYGWGNHASVGYATQTWVDSQIYLRKYAKSIDFNFLDGSDNESGVYYLNSYYDQPHKPSNYGQILAINISAGHLQIFNYNSNLKFRGLWWSAGGNTWTDWYDIYHSGNLTKDTIGLGNVENKSSATIRGELTASNVTTALGAAYVQNANYSTRAKYSDSVRDPDYHTSSSRRTTANVTWADGGLHYFLASASMTEGKPSTNGHIIHLSWDNSSFESQLFIPVSSSNSPQWRAQNGSWSEWYTIYHSGNCNNTSTPWSCYTLGVGIDTPYSTMQVLDTTYSNLAYKNVLSISASEASEESGDAYTGKPSYGILFRRRYTQSRDSNLAGIYAYGSSRWRGGLLFLTKTGRTQTGELDVNAMTITPSGNVGIGTTSPSQKLHVAGNILANVEVTAGSDARWKHNITPVLNGIDAIMQLRPSEWEWNSDNHKGSGLIAQQVQSVLPHLVKTDGEGYLHLTYDGLHAYEINAIQYHETEIDRLRRRVAQLERQLNIN